MLLIEVLTTAKAARYVSARTTFSVRVDVGDVMYHLRILDYANDLNHVSVASNLNEMEQRIQRLVEEFDDRYNPHAWIMIGQKDSPP